MKEVKYGRRTRDYRRAYEGKGTVEHTDVEKHVKTQKKHRGADRQDTAWLEEN